MNSKTVQATFCGAALMAMAGPAAAGPRVVAVAGAGGEHLAASAEISCHAVTVRIAHRHPGGARDPGEHLHVRVIRAGSPIEVVRGIPPRPPRARGRHPGDHVVVSVPIPCGATVSEVRVVGIPRPHAACGG